MTEEEQQQTEEQETEEQTPTEEGLTQEDFNNIFNGVKQFLTKYGLFEEYKEKYPNVFSINNKNVYVSAKVPNWIYKNYRENWKKTDKNGNEINIKIPKEYQTSIDRIKGLNKLLFELSNNLNKNQREFLKNTNKTVEEYKKDIEQFNEKKIVLNDFYKDNDLKHLKTDNDLKNNLEKKNAKLNEQGELDKQTLAKNQQEIEEQKQQLAKQQQEIAAKKQEIEQQAQQHQQDIAERNRIENERAANIKHKALEEGKEEGKKMTTEEIRKMLEEDRRMQTEINNAQKDYINSKIYDGIYKLPHDKIVEIVQKDIENGKISTDNPEKMADMIYLESVRYINKHKGAIARLSKLQGYNPTQFGQLPPSIQEAVNDYVREKGEEDIIRKNRKYLLPKDLPRWERATQQHNVNPMLGRGAWSH